MPGGKESETVISTASFEEGALRVPGLIAL
jgi:hypothetical protein